MDTKKKSVSAAIFSQWLTQHQKKFIDKYNSKPTRLIMSRVSVQNLAAVGPDEVTFNDLMQITPENAEAFLNRLNISLSVEIDQGSREDGVFILADNNGHSEQFVFPW